MSDRPDSSPDSSAGPPNIFGHHPIRRRTFLAGASAAAAAVALNPPLRAGARGPDGDGSYISTTPGHGFFPLVAQGRAAPLVVSGDDHPGVIRVASDLQADIKAVTGVEPALSDQITEGALILGTIGTPLVDQLVASGALSISGIAGKWETSLEQVVDNPLPGVRRAFVIAGSDQRGTIFGAYDVSKKIGVSPWYWWDDVPPEHHDALYVRPGRHSQGTPAVKYRGLFINDENPDLGRWAPAFFGPGLAPGYPGVLADYGNLQALRKPELLNRSISGQGSSIVYHDQASAFSLTDYRELESVTERWQRLAARAEKIEPALPAASRDAYYELVGYNVKATANLYALRLAEFTHIRYAAQGRAATNGLADVAEARFADDRAMMDYFNTKIAGGKWMNFQSQPHIDYGDVARYGPDAPWQQPQINNDAIPDVIFPAVQRIALVQGAEMGVAIDGSDEWWPQSQSTAVLPTFSPYQNQSAQFIDVFNRGDTPFQFSIRAEQPWVRVAPGGGRVDEEVRTTVRVDWSRAPTGTHEVPITISGPGGASVTVQAVIDNPSGSARGFVEANGYVAIDAAHYTRAVPAGTVGWRSIPGIGRTDAGMQPVPVTAPSQSPGAGPRLEYDVTLFTTGPVTVWAYLSPRNATLTTPGLRYAISIDSATPQVVDVIAATGADSTSMNRQWERNTSDNVNRTATTHTIATPGRHVLTFWMVDPTVVLQRLIVDTGTAHISYLGPPESRRVS
jgi:Gylcosyl hydrolase family 115 C-terminal domain/Glycosyl hydrolase family 115